MTTIEDMRQGLVAELVAADVIPGGGAWAAAFATVPREVFVSRFFRQTEDFTGWDAVSADDPGALAAIYTDTTWVTQLDNDPGRWAAARASGQPAHGVPTSSSTAPSLMALMLHALDVDDGHRVLEIGTGTGYNAALLCERLGSGQVTTVEVDPGVSAAAATALHACGYTPSCLTGDGASGLPGGRYDRLIATCSTPTVPTEWIGKVQPGGLILTSLYRDLGGGPLVLLRVAEEGRAEGHFLTDYGGFMPVRSDPPADAEQRLEVALAITSDTETRRAAVDADVLDDVDFGMLAALRLPGVASIEFTPADTSPDGRQRWLLADDSASFAMIDAATGMVSQHGPRRIWDEVEAAFRQWSHAGRPTRDRYGLTVDSDGRHRYWLDTPESLLWTGNPGN